MTQDHKGQTPAHFNAEALNALLKNLREKHMVWQQAQQLMAPQLAPHFSPFTVYRSYEVDVSRHLALLLDPKGSHGQGRLFWDAWVEQVLLAQRSPSVEGSVQTATTPLPQPSRGPAKTDEPKPAPAVSDWLRHSAVQQVEREHRTTQLRDKSRRAIDLCVHLNNGLLAIENKPWQQSVDEGQQLSDYAGHLEALAKGKPWILVYLGQGQPSAKSLSPEAWDELVRKGQFVCVGWGQLLEALKQCLPRIQAPKVRWFAEDFVQMMERDAMNYTENAEMEHVAKAFNHSPQALRSALLLRNSLKQWQACQLKKLKQQLEACCKPEMKLQWHINPDAPLQKQAHFTLAFPGHEDMVMRTEWYWGFAHESDFYWGLYAPKLDLAQSQTLGAGLSEALKSTLPDTEPVEAGWPLWSFISGDPLFTPSVADKKKAVDEANAAEDAVVHPWLSVDYEHTSHSDFVTLVLQRYRDLEAALQSPAVQAVLSAQ